MTHAFPYIPGVPAAGHVTRGGFWHPGPAEGCNKCTWSEPWRCDDCGKTGTNNGTPDACPACGGPNTLPRGTR